MRRLKTNRVFAAVAALCMAFMGYALYAEHVLGLEPCPLCMLQRGAMLLVLVVSAVAALHNPRSRLGWISYGTLGFLAAGLGVAIAGRHVWLQNLPPDQVPACAPSLDYMLEVFPFGEMLQTILMTSGECAEIDWAFLGLSMPGWTLVWFVLFALVLGISGWTAKPVR